MHRHDETEVLMVGADPVGMLSAIPLAESGIQVKIIDQESRTDAHSYACASHPHTLKVLDQVGLAEIMHSRSRSRAAAVVKSTE